MTQQLLATTLKLESQYLCPLLVAQERTKAVTKCLNINQKKIQRAFRKRKVILPFFKCVAKIFRCFSYVNISLVSLDPSSGTVDDQAISTSLVSSSSFSFQLIKERIQRISQLIV